MNLAKPVTQTHGNIAAGYSGSKRRKHSRHRCIVDLNISKENGTTMHGMTFEIAAGGLSAATSDRLAVGDQVLLYPVIRNGVTATIRSKNGPMYGFECLAQPPEFQQQILELWKTLPLFQTMADV
jgi:hypothetical protein